MHRNSHFHALATLLAVLLTAGCASPVPLAIRQGPPDSPTPATVRAQPGDYAGRAVRWGGVLIATGNRAHATRLTVLARPLASDGRPGAGDISLGRFIAVVPEFLDPRVYAPDRLVTVTGTLRGSETGRVGEHPYIYPVVAAQAWYLWPEPAAPHGEPHPWWYEHWYGPWWYGPWYDPWYDPWYSPRWSPRHHPHRHAPDPSTPAPDTGPGLPEPPHPRPGPHQRPPHDTTPPPGQEAPRPHRERPRKWQGPGRHEQRTWPPRDRPWPDHAPRSAPQERTAPPPPPPAPADTAIPDRPSPGFFRRWRSD
ncbi:MAG: Slp family lipoprotein [Gammaproteobacteria bacterium]|jgi:outer membrane lipoprotein